MDKLNEVLRIRISGEDLKELKAHCGKLDLKYTDVVRGMIKLLNKKASEERFKELIQLGR